MDLLEQRPSQLPNKTDIHKYEMSSETYRWILTDKRRIQLFENSSVFSRPPSHCDTLSALSSANLTWGAKSHGEDLSPRFHMDPGVQQEQGATPQKVRASPEQSQQAGRVTMCHTQSHTILLAHQYLGASFVIKAVLFQINTPEKG